MELFQFEEGIEYIKIHGLQRSGTNYLVKLINENIHGAQCLVNAGGWKHGHYCAPWTLGREVHVLAVVKNPYAWLVSLYHYWRVTTIGPNLRNVSFDQFVQSRVEFERQQGIPFLYRSQNPVQFWNDMNFHWMSIRLDQKKSLVIPYEALLSDANGVTKAIAQEFGMIINEKFIDEEMILTAGGEKPLADDNRFEKDYYVQEKFMESFNDELLQFVNDQLDHELVSSLGYRLVTK
jgi:hypothetical protein